MKERWAVGLQVFLEIDNGFQMFKDLEGVKLRIGDKFCESLNVTLLVSHVHLTTVEEALSKQRDRVTHSMDIILLSQPSHVCSMG